MSPEVISQIPNERAQYLLKVLIQRFIRDGQPVGSRTLSQDAGIELSPATIRNVMSDLEAMGLISAPHTSAGRIPTAQGYRLFVDTLIRYKQPKDVDIQKLQTQLNERANDPGALLDSVFDRLGEASLFVGLAVYGLRAGFSDNHLMFFISVLLLALIFSQGVSYLRARGEGLGVFTRAGLMTRPERVVILGIGLIIDQIVWVLLAIALVSCFTLFQRMFTIRGMLKKGS